MSGDRAPTLDAHYGRAGLSGAIDAAIRAAGLDPEALAVEDLAAFDHFHTRGREATQRLAELAELAPAMQVLDVGGGIGGPARLLARDRGCRVTVLDLTEEYCRVGADLTRRAGLAERVTFRHGSALDLPFGEASFDAAWTQHSNMNIEDKERLYREVHRVLRPGGRLAVHEIMAGPRQPIHFPVPWARDPALSFLRPPDAVRTLVAGLGFAERHWLDTSAPALEFFRQRLAAMRAAPAPPPLGLHLLLGADTGAMLANMARNLEDGRVRVIKAVWQRD